jgi:hypothetical protein
LDFVFVGEWWDFRGVKSLDFVGGLEGERGACVKLGTVERRDMLLPKWVFLVGDVEKAEGGDRDDRGRVGVWGVFSFSSSSSALVNDGVGLEGDVVGVLNRREVGVFG